MYPDTANVEALVNRYFINDEPGLVREMGAKFRISGHTHMPHEAVVGKTTSIWKPRWVPQRSAGSGNPPGPDDRDRGRLSIAMMPPHDTYIETHLGGGAIMRRKPAALHNIGIDRDARALGEFECDYPVELIHGCAHRFLSEYAFEGSELLYSDPPYLKRTRTSKRRYRFDYEEADHVELLELLKAVPCQVMVSGYRSALYEERLEGWRSVALQVMNHAGVRTECVWMNFAPDRLHWARYAGRNFTDRQRIKRKAESWGRRYTALPVGERLAVLGAMMAVEAQR